MEAESGNCGAKTNEIDWINMSFLLATPVIGIVGTALYTWAVGFQWWMLILLVGMYLAVGLSICGGYHRYFSHKAYECHRIVQRFYAFFGAMAAQNSILWWSSAHRVHHRYVDRDWDPYNIRRGFWWAHIIWIFYKNPDKPDFSNARDLEKNDIVQWQHRWYFPILLVGGFGVPTAIGALFGDPIAGLMWGGFTRLVLIHHTTFFVNSLAHYVGEKIYDDNVSARDNWAVAFVTLGEGYHSFHHRFASDFRNGIRWYHWDPTKWFISGLHSVGLASKLRVTSAPAIEQARMEAALKKIEHKVESAPSKIADEIRERIAAAHAAIERAVELWRLHLEERANGKSWRATRRNCRRFVEEARREWREAVRMTRRLQTA